DGCCHHGGATYTFDNGRLDTLSTWNSQWGYSGTFTEYTTGKKINDRWQDHISYSIRPIKDTTLLRSAPAENSRIIKSINQETEVRILKEKPLWFYVSENSDEGKSQYGWLKKSDLFTTKNMQPPYESDRYRFFALSDDNNKVIAIKVESEMTGKTIQIIPCYRNIYYAEHFFETGDYNNDGEQDFRVKQDGFNHQTEYTVFLYDKKKGVFVKQKNTN